ncbi:hypothetical protein DL346_02060 [Paenibacillus montanisoli]|uniref:Uncharacterized protein n=1 Tax=Paenibacillus montanisoli TaxID=2081970 RepID=A0A328UAK3_9BACL|nr:hypothetical protein DL346_02060 [Paenibacillus montanisoli]
MKTILLKGVITSLVVPTIVFLILKGIEVYTGIRNNAQKDESDFQYHDTTFTVFWFQFGLMHFVTLSILVFICFMIIVYAVKVISRLLN